MKEPLIIDKNLVVKKEIEKEGMTFYPVLNDPFKIYGVTMESGDFVRMPKSVARTVSERLEFLNYNTAGGRVRFKTDSRKISIISKMTHVQKKSHIALTGSCGFDLFLDNTYVRTFIPPKDMEDGFESEIAFQKTGMKEVTINFPIYSGVSELLVGLEDGAALLPPADYAIEKPIVYYGSSITQGIAASRPGNTYQAIIARELDWNYQNLGFSGSARAEDEVIDYIKNLPMSVFVLDYDHNAPDPAFLEATHEKAFQKVRQVNPDLPIVMLSRPRYLLIDDDKERLEVVKKTYDNAVAAGDKNVYFIEGPKLMEIAKDAGMVDGTHPTDLGFFSMAQPLIKLLKTLMPK